MFTSGLFGQGYHCVQSYWKQSSTVELLRIITDRVDSNRKEIYRHPIGWVSDPIR